MTEQSQQPKSGGGRGAMPMGSTVAIIVAAVAVVLGLLVLKKITDDDNNVTAPPVTTPLSVPQTNGTTVGSGTGGVTGGTSSSSGAVTPSKTGSKIQVANASRKPGAGRKVSTLLDDAGYSTGTPVTGKTKLTDTVVYYTKGDAKAQAVALSVADTMGADAPSEMPTTLDIDEMTKLEDGVGVLVMLGTDKADKTLSAMTGDSSTADTGTEAGTADGTTP